MAFELPALPYPDSALEPAYSAKTLGFHHGKHHKAYVDNLNKLPNAALMAAATLPVGRPPPPGAMPRQKKVWFQACAALLKKPALPASVAVARMISSRVRPSNGLPGSSLFRLSTYAL